jgi:hypothetical protein
MNVMYVKISTLDTQAKRDAAHYAVHFANRALVARSWSDISYVPGRKALDAVMLHLARAKWILSVTAGTHAGFADKHESQEKLAEAAEIFDYVKDRARLIEAALKQNTPPPPAARADIVPIHHGTEIVWAADVPVIPTSCPVVVLQGNNEQMGEQYASQILEIYGPFILAWHAKRKFSDAEKAEIRRWEAELGTYMPEILSFARGMAIGASDCGLAMDYEHAVAMWTGVRPPARDARPFAFAQVDKQQDNVVGAYLGYGADKKPPAETPSPCSGAYGWGEATADGGLVASCSTDHDCTFQATIVAFPDRGNSFILTPFSANTSIPVLGSFHFGGHPGMNSRGVAYVHHGGANMGEPEEEWGYGVRRGPTVMHCLQFCNTAKEALDFMLKLPVGDTAISLGTAGGMFADSEYGFSLEARAGSPNDPKPIIRELTFDNEGKPHKVLYGANNAVARESAHLNAAPKTGKGYDYNLAGGWYTFDPDVMNAGSPGEAAKRRMTKNSECRNRHLYDMLLKGYGELDIDYMTMIYRASGTIPEGNYDDVCKAYNAGGQWDCSAGHRGNAFVAVMKPGSRNDGVYRACIGPANRAVNCRDPGHGYYYYDETAAFWELTLAASPPEMLEAAHRSAERCVVAAADALKIVKADAPHYAHLKGWLDQARKLIVDASVTKGLVETIEGDQRLAALSRAIRKFNWAQVRANQVTDAVTPPPDSQGALHKARTVH